MHHVAARMVHAVGAVDALEVAWLVPGEDIADFERADQIIAAVDQGDRLARFQGAR